MTQRGLVSVTYDEPSAVAAAARLPAETDRPHSIRSPQRLGQGPRGSAHTLTERRTADVGCSDTTFGWDVNSHDV